jgi:N-methylhydantoinase A
MGGRIDCKPEAAQKAVGQLAQSLGCSVEEAAIGVLQIVGTQMAEGIRIAAVRAGRDPRRHALLSFGGAAGLHVAQIARNLGISKVVIPPAASVFSAWGMLESDMRYERVRNVTKALEPGLSELLQRLVGEIEQELFDEIKGSQTHSIKVYLNMRYEEQIFEIPVEFDCLELDLLGSEETISQRFQKYHRSLYGYAPEDHKIVVVSIRFSLTCGRSNRTSGILFDGGRDSSAAVQRDVYLDGEWKAIPVWSLAAGQSDRYVEGPCLLRSPTTSILLGQSDRGLIGADRWVTLEIAPRSAQSSLRVKALAPSEPA